MNGVYTLEEKIGKDWYLCQLPPQVDCVLHAMFAFQRKIVGMRCNIEQREEYVKALKEQLARAEYLLRK